MRSETIETVVLVMFWGAVGSAVLAVAIAIFRSVLGRLFRRGERRDSAALQSANAARTRLEQRAALIAEMPVGQCDVIDCHEPGEHPGTSVKKVRGSWDWLIERLGGTAPARYRIVKDTRPTKCIGHHTLSHAKDGVWITSRALRGATSAEEEARALHEHNSVEKYDALCSDQAAALGKAKAVRKPNAQLATVTALPTAANSDGT